MSCSGEVVENEQENLIQIKPAIAAQLKKAKYGECFQFLGKGRFESVTTLSIDLAERHAPHVQTVLPHHDQHSCGCGHA